MVSVVLLLGAVLVAALVITAVVAGVTEGTKINKGPRP